MPLTPTRLIQIRLSTGHLFCCAILGNHLFSVVHKHCTLSKTLRMMISSILRKQNRSAQSLDTKLRVIGEIKEESSQKFVADKYKVAKSTINLRYLVG